MATASTGWSCVASASIVSQTDTTATIRVTAYWRTSTWKYDINWVDAWVYLNGESHQVMDDGSVDAPSHNTSYSLGYHDYVVNKTTIEQKIAYAAKITSSSSYVSGTKWTAEDGYITVPAKKSYTVSYNANGGSGAPGNQTKWHGTNLALSSTKPTRTGYSFLKWNTNSGGTGTSYNPGATYTGNANLALYAIWTANTYTVSYNANGGSGAPAAQTKTYGSNLTLSSIKPTRTNYAFKGWATSATGGVVYAAGGTYTANQAVTLYAVWELSYVKPRITNFNVYRCASGSDTTPSETGNCICFTFNWSTDKPVTHIILQYKTAQTDNSWLGSSNLANSSTSGTITQIMGGAGYTDSDYTCYAQAYVSDGYGSESTTTYSGVVSIGTVKYPIDVKKGGTGVAIGKVAEEDNVFDIGYHAYLRKDMYDKNGREVRADIYTQRTNDSNLSDVKGSILGSAYQDLRPYIITNAPITDDNYIHGGCSHTVYGMEYGNQQYGSQLSIGLNKMKIRQKWQGNWDKWEDVHTIKNIPIDANFDDYMANGIYVCGSAPTHSSAPMDITGVLEVFNQDRVITQIYTSWNGYFVWSRGYYAGSWNEWKNLAGAKFATYYPPERYTLTGAAWTPITINCSTGLSNTSYNTLTPSGSGIRIGKTVNTVKISASIVYYQYPNTGEVDLQIWKNSTKVVETFGHCYKENAIINLVSNPLAINVGEGDIIYLKLVKNSDSDMVILSGTGGTSLTVEVLN